MWNPLRISPLLARIVRLLEEQNALLRELHLTTTGHHALTPSRATRAVGAPKDGKTPPNSPRKTASDVWQRTPLSSTQREARENLERERAASQPKSSPNDDSHSNERITS